MGKTRRKDGLSINFNSIDFWGAAGLSSQLPESVLPEIVFAGRSNVGKSSLINKLCNRKGLARVSGQPGKTATINFYLLPEKLYLVDLPGYGFAKVSHAEKKRWSGLIEGYFSGDRDIRLVVSLMDARHRPTNDDLMMLNFLIDSELPAVVALTKIDKLKKTEREQRLKKIKDELGAEVTIIPFSSVTGEGVRELAEIIEEAAVFG